MKYRVTFPFIPSMGSVLPIIASSSSMETKEDNALWDLNNSREHDGLKPLLCLPKGTRFEPIP
jgi:hypothetical protein